MTGLWSYDNSKVNMAILDDVCIKLKCIHRVRDLYEVLNGCLDQVDGLIDSIIQVEITRVDKSIEVIRAYIRSFINSSDYGIEGIEVVKELSGGYMKTISDDTLKSSGILNKYGISFKVRRSSGNKIFKYSTISEFSKYIDEEVESNKGSDYKLDEMIEEFKIYDDLGEIINDDYDFITTVRNLRLYCVGMAIALAEFKW